MYRFGILPVPGFALMSHAATTEPLRAANLLAGRVLYDVVHVAPTRDAVQSSGAASVTPGACFADELSLDYLFVIAGGDPAGYPDRAVTPWLSRQARGGVVMGGVSGGPIMLARAGLMRDRRMTVHWEYAAALAEVSPELRLERTLFVMDRDRITCAGGTAPMDMMHALIVSHHGQDFARAVSDWFMHTEIRPPTGPQRASLVERVGTRVPAILDAVEAMESNIADPLPLPQLARIAGLSPRQLNRVFRQHLGETPQARYRRVRLERARNLLRNSALSLTEVALATGFASSSHFSRAYREEFGDPPSRYRSS
jgi:transcriptional regulator GlxA family with amidase domain